MLLGPVLYLALVSGDRDPKKIFFQSFFQTRCSHFITSELLLAKQGKNLAWAPFQGQGDSFNEFHWEPANWASVPFVFMYLEPVFLHSFPMLLCICAMWCGFALCCCFVSFSTFYFSGTRLEIFQHLAWWCNFFRALGWGNKFARCCSSVSFTCSQMVTFSSRSCLF